MFNVFQITVWFLLTLFVLVLVRKKSLKIFLALFLIGIGGLETVSLFLTDTLIDYRFYTHMNLESVENFGFLFIIQIIFSVIIYIFFIWGFFKVSSFYKIKSFFQRIIIYIAILFFVYILSVPEGILYHFFKIYQVVNASSKTFTQALSDVGINPNKYILPQNIRAHKGKNIIVISIESLEQGFLRENFSQVTPHLSALSRDWTFYTHMPVSPGAGWTAGSLYTHQVGIPAFFKGQGFSSKTKRDKSGYINEQGQGNDLFQHTSQTKLVGLGTVLTKAGYQSRYIMGLIEFAGVKDILNIYGFKTISEKNSIGKYKHKRYGMDDLDLFTEAKLQINDMLKKKDKPFALFMSTINTHFPNGVYDTRMEQYVSKQENQLEFTVASVDYLINDLIHFLKTKKLLDNTAIYIFPDHLLMGRGGVVHQKLAQKERKLYLLTNVKEGQFHKKISDTIYQVDLPKMILDGADIKHNAKFLVDFVDTDMLNFLDKKRVQLTTLNQASITRENFKKEIRVKIIDSNINIVSGLQNIVLPINIDYDVVDLTFTSDMVLIKKDLLSRQEIFKPIHYDIRDKLLHLTVVIENKKIKLLYLGNRQKIGLIKDEKNAILSEEEIQSIILSNQLFFQNLSERIIEIDKKENVATVSIFDLKSKYNSFDKIVGCMFEDRNNSIFFSAKHSDPVIFLPKIKTNTKTVMLYVEIESKIKTRFQIFYKRDEYLSVYNEKDTYIRQINKGVNQFQVRIPSKYLNNGLRVDMVSTKGLYKINAFRIMELE